MQKKSLFVPTIALKKFFAMLQINLKTKPCLPVVFMNISRNTTDNSETKNTTFESPDTWVFKFAYFFITICSKDN